MGMNKHEVDPAMDAILSIDTTKGNRIINPGRRTPTVGRWISAKRTSSASEHHHRAAASAFPSPCRTSPTERRIHQQHPPARPATSAPVVGVAPKPRAGCGTGASLLVDVEECVRFVIETAKAFGAGKCRFYDEDEYATLVKLYGEMKHLKTLGSQAQ